MNNRHNAMRAAIKREMRSMQRRSERPWDDELAASIEAPERVLQEPEFDVFRHVRIGLLLGAVAGCTSLMLNVIGSTLWPAFSGVEQHPLRLIQVFLTFPLGQSALVLNSGYTLALGCVLYLATGAVYGALLVPAMSDVIPRAGVGSRLGVGAIAGLILWAVNFYVLLTWLQPVLFGGQWIYQLIPWWVAALTHVVFGCTIALLYPIVASPQVDQNSSLAVSVEES
jgi:hypothetical protein